MDKTIQISSDFRRQSETRVSRLARKVCRHPNATKRVIEITNSNKTKISLVGLRNIVKPNKRVNVSSTAPENKSTTRSEPVCCGLRKIKVLITTHHLEAEKVKIRSFSTFATQSEVEPNFQPLGLHFSTQIHLNRGTDRKRAKAMTWLKRQFIVLVRQLATNLRDEKIIFRNTTLLLRRALAGR